MQSSNKDNFEKLKKSKPKNKDKNDADKKHDRKERLKEKDGLYRH